MYSEPGQVLNLKPGAGVCHINFKNLGLDSVDLLKQKENSSITNGRKLEIKLFGIKTQKQKGKRHVKLWRLLQITLGCILKVFEMKILAKFLSLFFNPR